MITENLIQYINKNAKFAVIDRAENRFPIYESTKGKEFFFICGGADDENYDIIVDLNNPDNIQSSCNCLYSGGGICKHEVASIYRLIELISANLIQVNGNEKGKKKPSPKTKIPHNNGDIDLKELNKIEFLDGTYYHSPFYFTSLTKNKLEARIETFAKDYKLSLKYTKKTKDLILDCSCSSPYPCSHKQEFIEQMSAKFGMDYFSPDYKERIKKRVIDEGEYKGLLDFDDVYELVINKDGLKVKEKLPNIVGADDIAVQLFEEDGKDLFLPETTEKGVAYGVALCFEKLKNQIVDVFPFYGKLDKTKTKLTTKFRIIDEFNFSEVLSIVNNKKSHAFMAKAIQLTTAYSEDMYGGFSLRYTKVMIQVFSSLIEEGLDQPIFLHDKRKSFLKKYFKELTVRKDEIIPLLKITDNKPFYQIDFKVKLGEKTYKLSSNNLLVLPFGLVVEDQLYVFKNPEIAFSILRATEQPQMHVINKGLDHLRTTIIEPFSKVFEIDFSGVKASKQKLETIERHVYLSDEEGQYIVLRPLIKYGDALVAPESKEKLWENESNLNYLKRDEALESNFLLEFKNLHPNFSRQSNYFYLTVEGAMESMWLMNTIEKLKEKKIRIFGLNSLESIRYNLNKPTISLGLSSGTDWFDMNIDVDFGDQKVDLRQIQKAIIKKSNYVELKDGTIGILPKEWIEKYKKYFKLGQIKRDRIEISNYQFNIIDELYEEMTNTPKFLEELYEKKKRLANLTKVKSIPKPKGIEAKLRPYQKEGLDWLVFLHDNQLGGCLADDMGLGKTIQTITFLQYVINNSTKKDRLPHLVITPTTLIFNWMEELKKFAPTLKALSFIGPSRKQLIQEITNNDIILTTYGSIIKDIEMHREIDYNYVILDESQAIKNPHSQRFKAVRLLRSKNRLALTGTPIENNTFDLYSQFNFLNPGIFGSVKHFKVTFSDAIDKEQDQYTSDLLARMINPFLLRRTKDQVARELPSKTETVIYCEMGKEQRKVYDHFKQYYRQQLKEQIEMEGVNKSQMYILQGLTKLRQICNSTALADKEKDYGNSSAKLDELIRQLKEKVNNHKVLVFSQFVGMLSLVKDRLKKENICFEYLDGQTRKREQKVNNFQNDDKIRVFLISLKAGGTGLNLTEAAYVYLIDPWWNPAVESQAIDRCYRIGQHKKVMAYRMICKDTIEEKIVRLQDKKKAIATDVVRVDQEKKSFNKSDVKLFFGGAEVEK